MDRKKFTTGLAAFLAGAALLAGNAQAELTGYVVGDPAPGKLVPYYTIGLNLATLIGIENTFGRTDQSAGVGKDVQVHAAIFTVNSSEQTNFDLCLSPYDFGFIVLQAGKRTPAQIDELLGPLDRFHKARVFTKVDDNIANDGYVAMRAVGFYDSTDGSCSGAVAGFFLDTDPEPLATWAILQDVGLGFFASEIPTVTARIDPRTLEVLGGFGAYGLIPKGNLVNVRYDVNPLVDSETTIGIWLANNGVGSVSARLECEDELEISTSFSVPNEVNFLDPDSFPGMGQCKFLRQYRGVVLFAMPDTGFVWSQISQVGQHFRENFIGYNLECNTFIENVPTKNDCVIGNPSHITPPAP